MVSELRLRCSQLDSLPADKGRFPAKKAGSGTAAGVVESRRGGLERWAFAVDETVILMASF